MKLSYIILSLLLLSATLGGITIGDWQNIRCSGETVNDLVYVRMENSQNAAADNKLLYYNGTQISELSFADYGAGANSYQAIYLQAGTNYDLGLASTTTGQIKKVNPVYYSGTGLPDLGRLTNLSADPANDQATNHLDIVADYFAFSDTKLFSAIQNRGGGFPLTATFGLPPYFSYMVVLADPNSDPSDPNTIVWAMNYMEVTFGGIAPGLYKITGTEADDLVRIGDISTEIVSASNLLKMSCDLSVLLADPDFSSWYNSNGHVIGVVSMTSRTTLSGFTPVTESTDQTTGAATFLTRLYNPINSGILPQLGELQFSGTEGDIRLACQYQDSQGRFPLSIRAEFLPGQTFELYPQSTDHSQIVNYRSANLLGLLNEYDEVPARAAASLDNINWAFSASQNFSYILGLQTPQNLTAQRGTAQVELVWDPVDQTLLGNPVEPDFYVVEADDDPAFFSPRQLDPVYDTAVAVPIAVPYEFYRVRAVKIIP